MIKHSFQNAGIWPVSFKAVKRKLKEYGKKSKRDTGLSCLKYGSESSSGSEDKNTSYQDQELQPDTQLFEEY
jgi:hypothetical protein